MYFAFVLCIYWVITTNICGYCFSCSMLYCCTCSFDYDYICMGGSMDCDMLSSVPLTLLLFNSDHKALQTSTVIIKFYERQQ